MEDYRLDQSGQEVQDILNGAAMQSDLTAETERATEAEQTLQDNIDAEATRAQGAEGTLQDNIDAEEARAKAAEKQNADDIDAIEEKIPSGASSSNKLATEEYVADAVATATATFRGTYNLVSDLHLNVTATEQQISAALAGAISTADNNDYCFILVPTSSETPTEIKEIDRYKFNGTAWAFEYKLNNSGFNAAQWAAINSGITSGDVAKLAALPTNAQLTTLLAGLQSDIDGEETRAKAAELAIQGNIDAEEVRAKAAEKQNADDIDAIEAVLPESASSENKVATESEINSLSAAIEAILLLIPSAATSLNKLADKAFVNSSIATATATFRGTYNLVNDLGLTTSATHAQIATALAGAILTADNNDYAFVQIPTSDAMPTEIAKTERYKFNGTAWEYEYDLNNSGFTADQWAAINSGITQALVTKLSALPTNAQLTTELGTLTSGITTINQKIPNAASQANKLVDTAAMESYIVEVLNVLTISYNVTSTDGHVTLSIEQVDGKITSVTLTTSDIASAADLNLKASQADLTALASRVTTAEGNITTLGGRMTTAEGNITTLGGRMTTAEDNITSLGGRVSTNETDIANLQQLYNDLQQSKPEPVTALPSTGQQQGVIYRLAGTTSYSDYMWNGSTWVLMATYNNAIDPRPKKASQNLVTSGGVFDNMGALDVSELNATENPHTLAKYVDLSAALAAIPTDYQKGGMSIKYVCSSDNNYLQYRYMSSSTAAADFTNTVNWQEEIMHDITFEATQNLWTLGNINISRNTIIGTSGTKMFDAGTYTLSLIVNKNTTLTIYDSADSVGYKSFSASTSRQYLTFTAQNQIERFFFQVSELTNITDIQFEAGRVATSYVPPYTVIDFKARKDNQQIGELLNSQIKDTYNLFPYDTTISLAVYHTIDNINLSAGNYTISALVESNDTDSQLCTMAFYDANGTNIKNVKLSRGEYKYINFNLSAACTKIIIYASDNYSHSVGDTATFTNILLVSGSYERPFVPTISMVDYVGRAENKETNAEVGDVVSMSGFVKPNLINVPFRELTIAGITFELNDDWSVRAHGTANADSGNNIAINLPRGKYILNGIFGGASGTYYFRVVRQPSGYFDLTNGEEFFEVTSESETIQLYFRFNNGKTFDTTFYPMIRKAEVYNSFYVKYGEYQTYKPTLLLINNTKFNWSGKKMNVLGDSIVAGSYGNFVNVIGGILNLSAARNYGIGGSRIASTDIDQDYPPAVTRYVDMDDDAQIIIVHAGTNDYSGQVPIGDVNSQDITTFNGALNVLMTGLRAKYPTALIIFSNILDRIQDTKDITCQTYRDTLEAACRRNHMVFYNGFTELNFDFHQGYYDHYLTVDGLHPNQTGADIMGRSLAGFINWH